MEQSILENSKGATYMSFILDIEIVIKKDGARVNVAETKTKSQVSKKKDGDSQEPYASSRNQDVKVYAVADTHRKSIFEVPWGNDEDSNLSESHKISNAKMDRSEKTKMKSLSKNDFNTNKGTENKENISDSIKFQEQTDATNIVEKTSISDVANLVPNISRPKKRKISKAEKKAKVFKGKVEPIDFLECNRIFMCNYLKIPMSRRKRNFDTNNRSSDSQVIASEENCSKCISVKQKSLSNQKLDKPTLKTLRLHTFWKKNSFSLINKDSMPDKYSKGDCDATNPSYVDYVDSNELEISKLNTIENSDSKTLARKNIMKRKRLISDFKYNGCRTSLSLRRNIEITDSRDNQNISTEYKEKDRQCTVLGQSKSMPKIKANMNLHNVTCAKSDINQTKYYKTIKKKSVSFIKGLRNQTNSKSGTAKEGLLGLQINCFDEVEYVLAPQLQIQNGSTQISNCSVDNICILKEENLADKEKYSHTDFENLGGISHETVNLNGTMQKKICKPAVAQKSCSKSVLEDRVSSSSITQFVLKNDKVEENCDKITDVNTVCMKNYVLPDLTSHLDNKLDTCAMMPQINISSPGLVENSLTENKCKQDKSYDTNSESEELKAYISNGKGFKTTPTFSSENSFIEGLVQKCDVDVSQTTIENQTTDKTEKTGKQGGKSKTPTLKMLHSYIKRVTTKFSK